MRKVICAALVTVFAGLCLACGGAASPGTAPVADEKKETWRDRLEKHRLAQVESHATDVKHWELKAFTADADAKAATKAGKPAGAKKHAADAKDFRAELERSKKALKECEVKDWTPPPRDMRTMRTGEFTHFTKRDMKVVQALDGGALIEYGRETFYLKNLAGVADGKEYEITGYIEVTGTFKYTTVLGAARTVVALELHTK